MLRNLALPVTVSLALTIAAFWNAKLFDPFSLFLIFAGTWVVLIFSYSRKQLASLFAALRRSLTVEETPLAGYLGELRRLTELFRLQGLKGLEGQESNIDDPFLRHGIELLVDLRNLETIRVRLEHRLIGVLGEQEIHRQILMTSAKSLPSFGLIGTLIGLLLLVGNLIIDDIKAIPSALALAVLSTLYGAILANVFVAPLLARLQSTAVEREIKMRSARDWVMMIARGDSASIADSLNTSEPSYSDPTLDSSRWTPTGLPARR